MARGNRSDRNRPPGTPGPQAGPEAKPSSVPSSYETVEYEEIDQQVGPGAPASASTEASDTVADSARDEVMTQPEDTQSTTYGSTMATEPEPPPIAAAPPPRRGGGFVPGLIGGLLGAAAVVVGGGWYAYEHGPVKPTLSRLDATEAAATEAKAGVGTLDGKLAQVGTEVGGLKSALQQEVGGLQSTLQQQVGDLKSDLQQKDTTIAGLADRIATTEKAEADLATNVKQASDSFRAAGAEVIGRLEAVNAKLVEVEQAQPADVVDKKTVADIAGKQAAIEQSTKSVADALARLEHLVTQTLESGNQQMAALRVVVDSNRGRMDEISAQQRDLLALKDQVEKQAEADQQQIAALAETGTKVAGVRTDLEQKLSDMTSKLTALDAARERGVGLSLATHGLETAMETGQPFESDMQMLKELGHDDPAITSAAAALDPLAAKGIPTYGSLATELGKIGQTLQPVSTAPSDDWLARTRENLQGLVNLHAVGRGSRAGAERRAGCHAEPAEPGSPGAVAALKPLAESGNTAAADWVASAQQRLDAGAAIKTLRERVKTMLVQQG